MNGQNCPVCGLEDGHGRLPCRYQEALEAAEAYGCAACQEPIDLKAGDYVEAHCLIFCSESCLPAIWRMPPRARGW